LWFFTTHPLTTLLVLPFHMLNTFQHFVDVFFLLHLGSSQFFLVLILCPDKIIVISGCQNNTVVIKKKIAMYASAVRCSCTSFVDCRAAYSSALVFLRVSFIALCVELSYYNASMSPPCLSVDTSSCVTPLSFALMIGPMVVLKKLKYSSMVNGTSFNHRNMSSTPYTGTSCLR